MNVKLKKQLAVAMVMLTFGATVSCKTKNVKNTNNSQGNSTSESQEAQTNLTDVSEIHEYKAETLNLPENESYLSALIPLGSNNFLVYFTDESGNTSYSLTDSSFQSYTDITPEIPTEYDNGGTNSIEFSYDSNDDTIYGLLTNFTYGGMTLPKDDEDFENFDYEAYYAAQESQICLIHYDKDFKIINSIPLDSLTEFLNDDENNYLSSSCRLTNWDENNLIFSKSDDELIIINKKDGTQTATIDISSLDSYSSTIIPESNGNLLCLCSNNNNGYSVYEMDKESMEFGDSIKDFEPETSITINAGVGNYRFFLEMSDGLYGYTDNGELKLIINWLDSGIDSNYSYLCCAMEDGSFIMISYGDGSSKSTLLKYTRKSPDEIKDKTSIRIGLLGDVSYFTSEINDFNSTHDDYKMAAEIIDSSDQLKLDIISGTAPDIIINDDFSMIQSLGKKGVFADYYDLMENDSEINRDTVLPNILIACESNDGKLYTLPENFQVSSFMIKSKYWEKDTMTVSELMNLYKNPPVDGMKLSDEENTKTSVFTMLANDGDCFVDYENGTCNFDSSEFIDILNFCNTFPDEEDMPDKETDPEGHQNYYSEKALWLRNDKALMANFYLDYLYNYNYEKYSLFGEDVTLFQLTSDDKKIPQVLLGTQFSIMNNSENKQQAWEFIKLFLTKENYTDSDDVVQWSNFSITNSALDKMAADSVKKQGINETFYVFDNAFEIPVLNQDDCDLLKKYILNADTVTNSFYDSTVSTICDEELQAFFAGEQTADTTAQYIQNKVSIMLSEQS